MSEPRHVAAIDLGASSGRVVLGRLSPGRVELEVVHRFENRPLRLPDGLHWNLPSLFEEALCGLAAAAAAAGAPLVSIGVDSWGCDYALLDGSGRMLGVPYHYRDERTTGAVLKSTHELVSRSELYLRTGIQTLPINTIFQLRAERNSAAASVAEGIALIPDLIALWLTGNLANELTIASTTGLLDAGTSTWAIDLIARLGLPAAPFSGQPVPPGSALGPVLGQHTAAGRAIGAPVHTVAGHDTASAFAAAPVTSPNTAILSSGTWSLLGLELDRPLLSPGAAEANFTNEQGLGGTIRLLRNIMGLWLLEESRRAWAGSGEEPSFAALQESAKAAGPEVALFDPDHSSLLAPGNDMPERIRALIHTSGQRSPGERGEFVRSILVSLACKYRSALEQLEALSGRHLEVIHVVGGGARNELLCQLTADLCQRQVVAGPSEATALGNVLVQAMAVGDLGDVQELRELAARSSALRRFEPTSAEAADETFRRFLELTEAPTARRLSPA